MRRIVLWGSLVLVVVVAAAIVLLPRWLGSDASRQRVEAILSEALGREVTIEALEVAADASVLELRGVTVAQPEDLALDAPDEGPLLRAERVRLEVALGDLLDRRVVGLGRAEGVTLTVLERGGHTSVHGLGRRPKEGPDAAERPPAEPLALALDLELSEVLLRWVDLDRAEAIQMHDVALRGHLGDRAGTERSEREAVATLTASALELGGVGLREIMVQMRLHGPTIQLTRLHARVGAEGILEGHGVLGRAVAGEAGGPDGPDERDWSVALTLRNAALDGPLRDLAAIAIPAVVRVTGAPGEPTTGRLDATVALGGRGLHWESIAPSLHGTAALGLRDVVVPADTTVLELATLAGREPGPFLLDEARVELSVAEGWVTPTVLALGSLSLRVTGRVSVRGQLDLLVDLMPFVERFGGGTYATIARTTTTLPVRVTGSVREPKLAPPRVRDVAAGLLGGAIRRAIEPSP
ncbi:MAG: hypothetical protein AAGF11_14550 [Myxococcota bacterium]